MVKRKKPSDDEEELNQLQRFAVDQALAKKSFLLTGGAGTGKSVTVRAIINALRGKCTVSASTGIAALHIGGKTLHAVAKMGLASDSVEDLLHKHGATDVWTKVECLIVDEISMVSADFFEKCDAMARAQRHCDEPFGGIQVICSGDFGQLGPISGDFIFSGWNIHTKIELTEVYRQKDATFAELLNRVRTGDQTLADVERLRSRVGVDVPNATAIEPRRNAVAKINAEQLGRLPGAPHCFPRVTLTSSKKAAKLAQLLCKDVDEEITLKKDALVLLTANYAPTKGLVNGSRGIVVGFDEENNGLPIVQFANVTTTIWPYCYELSEASITAKVGQIPLMLAWASTIHRVQGLSLDAVKINLGKEVFAPGQAYTALSRCRTFDNITLTEFEPSSLVPSAGLVGVVDMHDAAP